MIFSILNLNKTEARQWLFYYNQYAPLLVKTPTVVHNIKINVGKEEQVSILIILDK